MFVINNIVVTLETHLILWVEIGKCKPDREEKLIPVIIKIHGV